jgi:hypothetical protein
MLFEERVPRLPGDKWVEVKKGQMRPRASTFVLETACLRFYDFGRNTIEILKITH